jgi:hypothetical protein
MLQCPKCGSADIRPSRPKRAWEVLRKKITATSPYRCARCDWRGWTPGDQRLETADSATTTSQPRLWDAFVAAAPARFDELDLDALNIPRKHAHRESY